MRVRTAHVSLQYNDTDRQHTQDIEKIFDRGVERRHAWITGTEAGPGSGNTGKELIRIAREHKYRPWVPNVQGEGAASHTDCWIAVREDLIKGDWTRGFRQAIPAAAQLERENPELPKNKTFGPRGVVHVGFDSLPQLGRISVGAAHHISDSRTPASPWWDWNEKLDKEIAEWMKEVGEGPDLAFFNTDRNFPDTKTDTQKIGDSTTLADELHKWQNTGHGPIDWMLSYNKDKRVTGRNFVVLDDKEFFLHTDHFYLEGTFGIAALQS